MKKALLKKAIACCLAVAALSTVCVGCQNNGTNGGSNAPAAKTKVDFWYLWTGDGDTTLQNIAKEYNAKSDKYEVKCLSTPDQQKITAAISAGNGPDLTDDFNGSIGKLAAAGVMEPLDDYISKTNYDMADFVPAAIDSMKMDGKIYAMPCNINFSALYYNKTILKDAGYTEAPKTLEEMYEMAVKTTKVNKDGTIDTLGFPDFPNVYYLGNFNIAAGGGWYTDDSKASAANDAGNTLALKLIADYRQKFGVANITKFASGAKYLDPTDPFLMGKQTFRVDGPWMGKNIKETFKVDIDYGVTYIPYPAGKEDLKARALVSSSILYIPSNAKNKDGAWDFLSYLVGKEGMQKFTVGGGDFPARISSLSTDEFKKSYDSDFYAELAKSPNLVSTKNNPKASEYETTISEQAELCMNLKQDIPTTLNNINKKGVEVLG